MKLKYKTFEKKIFEWRTHLANFVHLPKSRGLSSPSSSEGFGTRSGIRLSFHFLLVSKPAARGPRRKQLIPMFI